MLTITTTTTTTTQVIIMAFTCGQCGFRSTEVKPSAESAPEGAPTTLELRVRTAEDWNRLVLKSHTAEIEVPEIDLHLAPGTLGSTLTTVEGLLAQVCPA